MKKILRLISAILCLSVFTTTITSVTIEASNDTSEIIIASDVTGERTNIQYLEGNPGDSYLVYTYQQNGNMYKSIENSAADFSKVECQIFRMDEYGNCELDSLQRVSTDNDGNVIITIESATGKIEERTMDLHSSILQIDSINSIADEEWITEYYDGSRGGLAGLTISALIAIITAIATYYTSGALSSAAVSGASAIATGLFNRNSEIVYYYAIRNWRRSPKNYFVIDEAESTEYFIDSTHSYSLGYTYAEYIF